MNPQIAMFYVKPKTHAFSATDLELANKSKITDWCRPES
jgi:hypothetical protein